MRFRILTEPQQGATYSDLLKVARTAEEAGYDGFFRSDHYLKIGGGLGVPGPTDAWITIAGLARETSRIRLGTLVSPATFRHPSVLAISVAQADTMSGGRVELGLGAGWFVEEHQAYGIPLREPVGRFAVYSEYIEIVTGLWRTPHGEVFNFDGEHFQLSGAQAPPTPAQVPHPPIIVGGTGKQRTPTIAAAFANEYNLIFVDPSRAAECFERVAIAAARRGRPADEIVRSVALIPAVGHRVAERTRRIAAITDSIPGLVDPTDPPEFVLHGSPDEVVDRIGRYRERAGISRLYFEIFDLSDLDQVELLAAEVVPQLR